MTSFFIKKIPYPFESVKVPGIQQYENSIFMPFRVIIQIKGTF
jgi:hypothetical protein